MAYIECSINSDFIRLKWVVLLATGVRFDPCIKKLGYFDGSER